MNRPADSRLVIIALCALLIVLGMSVPLLMWFKNKPVGGPGATAFTEEEKLNAETRAIKIVFTNGIIEVTEGHRFFWDCEGMRPKDLRRRLEGETLVWELPQAHCKLIVPSTLAITIKGMSGRITLRELSNPLVLELAQGEVIVISSNSKTDQIAHGSLQVGAGSIKRGQ